MDFASPRVMGIVNATPDSFFGGSRTTTKETIRLRVEKMLAEGADIIDVGGCSTRPYSTPASEEEETERVAMALETICENFPDVVLSVDTFRAKVAAMAVDTFGADIINDVSGGSDPDMFATTCDRDVPYILTSTAPTLELILTEFAEKLRRLYDMGQKDVILDPGFGFGKALEDNFKLLAKTEQLLTLGLPVLAGISRKRMTFQPLDTTPDNALNATTVLNTILLGKGVHLLRVHDVAPAVEAVKLYNFLKQQS